MGGGHLGLPDRGRGRERLDGVGAGRAPESRARSGAGRGRATGNAGRRTWRCFPRSAPTPTATRSSGAGSSRGPENSTMRRLSLEARRAAHLRAARDRAGRHAPSLHAPALVLARRGLGGPRERRPVRTLRGPGGAGTVAARPGLGDPQRADRLHPRRLSRRRDPSRTPRLCGLGLGAREPAACARRGRRGDPREGPARADSDRAQHARLRPGPPRAPGGPPARLGGRGPLQPEPRRGARDRARPLGLSRGRARRLRGRGPAGVGGLFRRQLLQPRAPALPRPAGPGGRVLLPRPAPAGPHPDRLGDPSRGIRGRPCARRRSRDCRSS